MSRGYHSTEAKVFRMAAGSLAVVVRSGRRGRSPNSSVEEAPSRETMQQWPAPRVPSDVRLGIVEDPRDEGLSIPEARSEPQLADLRRCGS